VMEQKQRNGNMKTNRDEKKQKETLRKEKNGKGKHTSMNT